MMTKQCFWLNNTYIAEQIKNVRRIFDICRSYQWVKFEIDCGQALLDKPLIESQKIKNREHHKFSSLPRENLSYGITENRILLYETTAGEKLYIQYPGLESSRPGNRKFPLDFRPVLVKADGSYSQDMDFKKIWDIIDLIGQNHKADIDILATIFCESLI